MKPPVLPQGLIRIALAGLVMLAVGFLAAAGTAAEELAVISPSGGEVWAKDSTRSIQWTAPEDVETVDLFLWHEIVCFAPPCPQRPSALYTIAQDVPNTGRYDWDVPSLLQEIGLPPSGRYYVRVVDPATGDFADAAAPFLMVSAEETAARADLDEIGKTYYAVHFSRGARVGDDDSYIKAGFPKPALWSNGINLAAWHNDPVKQETWLRSWAKSSAALGIKGAQINMWKCPKRQIRRGKLPPFDVLIRRYETDDQLGLLQDIEHIRDVVADLVDQGYIDHIVLRPFQEAGAGESFGCGFTPKTFRESVEWIANDVYKDLPVRAVVSHWNTMRNIERTIPVLDDKSIEVYVGISIYMPSWPHRSPPNGGDMYLAAQQLDFASRAWKATGKKTWVVEFSIFADGREDPSTGWKATGLRYPSVIPNFFEHYRTMRANGHIAGITWFNTTFEFAGGPIDGRWDAPHTHPDVAAWWKSEVTRENGYILGFSSRDRR